MHPKMHFQGDGYEHLRRMDFPYCAHEALKELNLMIRADVHLNPTKPELQALVNEFVIFDISSAAGKHRKTLGSIQTLHLLEILSDFFSPLAMEGGRKTAGMPDWAVTSQSSGKQPSERQIFSRNAAFMAVFHPGCPRDGAAQRFQRQQRYHRSGQESPLDSAQRAAAQSRRVELLVGLVSLAVSTSNQALLDCAGHWMKKVGCTSACCLRVARAVVDDHLLTAERRAAAAAADRLPALSETFTVCLLTAIAQLYADPRATPPPAPLLKQMQRWWEGGPQPGRLPLAPLRWSSPDPDCCPVVGLWRWSVYAALESDGTLRSIAPAMARLHFLLIACLMQLASGEAPPSRCPPWIPLLELVRITDDLVTAGCGMGADKPTGAARLALDRMVQLFQVAYEADALEGLTPATRHRDALQTVVGRLYPTRLLQIVVLKQRSALPPE